MQNRLVVPHGYTIVPARAVGAFLRDTFEVGFGRQVILTRAYAVGRFCQPQSGATLVEDSC